MAKRKLQARLQLETEFGAFLGCNRIRLLEAIDKQGSISKAARSIPMSYKAAWDALEDLNNLADEPVLLRSIGGTGGGGTALTEYGRKLVAMFHAVEGEYQAAMDQLYRESGEIEATDKAAFQRLLKRITLRSSARNQFVGTVSRVVADAVDAQVYLSVGDDFEIQAQVTAESVKRLELVSGREVVALVKAPAVMLLAGKFRKSADTNYLAGSVSRLNKGPANTEVVVDVPLARVRHVTAVITSEDAASLGLKVGMPVTAAFPASSVILTTFA
ncbi:MAG TPA: TOBE domain-containing protein [Burkholderiales bacterium]|nr:TOBE domain-containing protein [Burkholderiales bacterium]